MKIVRLIPVLAVALVALAPLATGQGLTERERQLALIVFRVDGLAPNERAALLDALMDDHHEIESGDVLANGFFRIALVPGEDIDLDDLEDSVDAFSDRGASIVTRSICFSGTAQIQFDEEGDADFGDLEDAIASIPGLAVDAKGEDDYKVAPVARTRGHVKDVCVEGRRVRIQTRPGVPHVSMRQILDAAERVVGTGNVILEEVEWEGPEID